MDAETLAKYLPGRYQLLKALGAGAMGIVYQAYDRTIKRMVAIKVLIKKDSERQSSYKRFYREMEAVARLNHPDIVKVYDMGNIGRMPYMVMEYVDGVELLQYCRQNSLSSKDKLALIHKIALALNYAHERQVTHRDIKPANIMVRSNGEPILMDFGCAKITEVSDKSLTRSGEVLGTPEYMSPEQASGVRRDIDSRTDIYSLGAVLYHLLAGKPPVEGDTFMETLYRLVEMRHPPLLTTINPKMSREVENICLKAMAKNKAHRYQNGADFADDIQRYLQGEVIRASRFHQLRQLRRLVLIPAGVIILLLTISWLSYRLCQQSPFEKYQSCRAEAMRLFSRQKYAAAGDKFQQALYWLEESRRPNAYRRERKALMLKLIDNYYRQSQNLSEANADLVMMVIDKALKFSARLKPEEKAKWYKQLILKKVQIYYLQGREKMKSEPEQATIYLRRAREMIAETQPSNSTWLKQIDIALIRSYYRAGNYQQIYQLAQHGGMIADKDTEWLVAKAAYQCGDLEGSLARLQKLANLKKQAGREEYELEDLENLYSQGMIYWRNRQKGKAEAMFAQAWPWTRQGGGRLECDFMPDLALYYSASQLYDFQRRWPEKELAEIAKKLKLAAVVASSANFLKKFDYLETRCRYQLRVIARKYIESSRNFAPSLSPPEKKIALEVIEQIDKCIQARKSVGVYYYIRSRANYYLGQYEQALADLSIACDLNPMNLQLTLSKLDILEHYAKPEAIQSYYQDLSKATLVFRDEAPVPLLPEFQQWQAEYRTRLVPSPGIPFSPKNFEHFYTRLFSKSEEIRRVARQVLCNLQQPKKVLEKLEQKAKQLPEHSAVLAKLSQEIKQSSRRMQQNKLCYQLLEVPLVGAIPQALIEMFHDKVDFLKNVFLAKSQEPIFLRLLAARILAHLPSETTRAILYHHCNSKNEAISIRIIATWALYGIGLTYFDNESLAPLTTNDPILLALVAEILLPISKENLAQLYQLLKSEDIRVRVLAASRFSGNALPSGEMLQAWQKAIIDGNRDSNPQVRALAIFSLLRLAYPLYIQKKYQVISWGLPAVQRALQDPELVVKRAGLAMIYEFSNLITDIDTQEIIANISKILQASKEPVIRYRCIVALVSLGDSSALEKFIDCQRPLAERMAALIGVAQIKTKQLPKSILKRLTQLDPDPKMSGMVILLISRLIFSPEKKLKILKLLAPTMAMRLQQFLQHKSPFIRLCSIISAMKLTEIPRQLFHSIEERFRIDKNDNVRLLALSAIFYHGFYYKYPQLASWQAMIIKKLRQRSPQARQLAMAAVTGYYRHIEEDTEYSLDHAYQMNWHEEYIRNYRLNILHQATLDRKLRKRYIDCLQRCLTILAEIKDAKQQQWYANCIYLLASIYNFHGDSPRALRLVARACADNGWRNADLIELWAQITLHQPQKRRNLKKTWDRLESALAQISEPQSAKVLRRMAQIAEIIKPRKASELFIKQYYIAPRHPLALVALGDYYYRHRDYDRAYKIFEHAGYAFNIGAAYFGLAAAAASLRKSGEIMKCLVHAWHTDYFNEMRQLRKYPVLNKRGLRERIRDKLEKWNQRGNRRSNKQRFHFKKY